MARRRFSRSRQMTRRERVWIKKDYPAFIHPTGVTNAFELLGAADYTETGGVQTDHCTVLRAIGRYELDPIVAVTEDGGAASVSYYAAIAVVSELALLLAAPLLVPFDPRQAEFQQFVRIVHSFCSHNFTTAVFPSGVGPTTFLGVSTGDEQRFGIEWDITQKLRLKTDQALYFFCNVITTGTLGEGSDYADELCSRVLYAD